MSKQKGKPVKKQNIKYLDPYKYNNGQNIEYPINVSDNTRTNIKERLESYEAAKQHVDTAKLIEDVSAKQQGYANAEQKKQLTTAANNQGEITRGYNHPFGYNPHYTDKTPKQWLDDAGQAALALGLITNPTQTLDNIVIGTLAGEGFNIASNKLTKGKNSTWGQLLGDLFQTNSKQATALEYTNPGYLLSGKIPKYSLKGARSVKMLPRVSKSTIAENKEFLDNANNYFYNYPPIKYNYELLENTEQVNQLVKDRIAEHNTFLRGVRDPLTSPHKKEQQLGIYLNEQLDKLGIPKTRENRLKYAVTHLAGYTGAGRAGVINESVDGALYTSNSLRTAAGYARANHGLGPIVGEVAAVRRPYILGNDRTKWFEEGDFNLYDTDKRKQHLEQIIQQAKQNEINFGKSSGLLAANTLLNKHLANIDKTPLSKKQLNDIYNSVYFKLYNTYDNNIEIANRRLKRAGIDFALDKKLEPTHKEMAFVQKFLKNTDALSRRPVYNAKGKVNAIRDLFYKKPIDEDDLPFDLYDSPIKFGIKDASKKQGFRILQFKDVQSVYDKLVNYVNNPYAHRNKELDNFLASIEPYADLKAKASLPFYLKKSTVSKKDLSNFNKKVGYTLHKRIEEDNRYLDNNYVFTSEHTRLGSEFDDNYQHYIFRGNKGDKALDFVRFLSRDEIEKIDNASRQHIGVGTPGYSRKLFNDGGSLTKRHLDTTKFKDGGIYIKPENRGKFTELKKRTGYSATWFKQNGTPAQKKMATFALNAAKWKH